MSILAIMARSAAVVWMATFVIRADLLNPLSSGPAANNTPVPLKPPAGSTIAFPGRAMARPAFDWKAGDRVVLLGDSVLARDAELGFIETRLITQQPDRDFQVRNLAWLTNHPLAGVQVAGDEWLAGIKREVAPLKPTVIGVAFGNDLRETDDAAVDAFRSSLTRLLDGLTEGPAQARPRIILFTPVGRLKPADGDAAAQNAARFREKVAEVVGTVATNRNAEFVNLFAWVQPTEDFLKRVTEGKKQTYPPMFDDRQRLTAFGYYRATLAVERSLRWRSGNWRFGYMSDNTLRDGGFGTRIEDRQRAGESARVKHTEEMLPVPNPDGFVDRQENTRPQCYIQLSGLAPGMYALRVDGQEVQRAADDEWSRYQIITDGPSWQQAERLRQLIVQKNGLLVRRWAPGGEARSQAEGDPDLNPFSDPALKEIEEQIAATRKPVARVYEFVRVGDAPKTNSLMRLPGGAPTIQVSPPK